MHCRNSTLEDEELELRNKLLAKRKDKDRPREPRESRKHISMDDDEMFSVQPGAQVAYCGRLIQL